MQICTTAREPPFNFNASRGDISWLHILVSLIYDPLVAVRVMVKYVECKPTLYLNVYGTLIAYFESSKIGNVRFSPFSWVVVSTKILIIMFNFYMLVDNFETRVETSNFESPLLTD